MKPHAFVAMPFGVKPDADGAPIDFNRVYEEYIEPAVREAGLEVLRADQEQRGGDIRADMFQELLVADLVIADLTIDNPNVWYELGVRHALRARGVVLVCGGRTPAAFDLYTDRKLRYSIRDRGPDPAKVEQEREQLTSMVRATMECWHGRKISPVYHLLPNLQEPDWKSLRVGAAREFWDLYDAWEANVELARQAGYIGDVLVLADEAPVAAFRAEAWIRAGQALRQAEHFDFALEQLARGLEIEPDHLDGLREEGICLQRLAAAGAPGHSLERARQHYRKILASHPDDAETWALLGRVDKDAWTTTWDRQDNTDMRQDAAWQDALLRAAIDSYAQGFRRNPGHYFSGINALTLMHLHRHLTDDPHYDRDITLMAGAVRFAAENERHEQARFWSAATLADIEVLSGTPATVSAAYKTAIARNPREDFDLGSCRAQLLLLKKLGYRPENVDAALVTFERALTRTAKAQAEWRPRQVFLFSGHMIDAPDRSSPRFPADKAPLAAAQLTAAFDRLGAGPDDLALTQGACGGDLLFSEACLARGVKLHWLQPFAEAEFIQRSVARGGDDWRTRYYQAREQLAAPIRCAPHALGDPPQGIGDGYPYERCNLWLLYTALALGIDKVQFICLWNGAGGDGPGGTAHMYEEVQRRTGKVTWIDTREL